MRLHDLTTPLLQRYYEAQLEAGLSPNTIRKHHSNIRCCLAHAVQLGYLSHNPAERVKLPKKGRYEGAKALTAARLREVLDAFEDDELEVPVRIAVNYGLRRGEVCGLRWDAVDFEAGVLRVWNTAVVVNGKVCYSERTKTDSSRRELPLTSSMRDYLLKVKADQEEQRQKFGKGYTDSGLVCVRPDGVGIHPNTVTHRFRRVLEKHGLQLVRFHDLRHSVVNVLRRQGVDIKKIQEWIGHSEVSTTLDIYGHLLDDELTWVGTTMENALQDKAS